MFNEKDYVKSIIFINKKKGSMIFFKNFFPTIVFVYVKVVKPKNKLFTVNKTILCRTIIEVFSNDRHYCSHACSHETT